MATLGEVRAALKTLIDTQQANGVTVFDHFPGPDYAPTFNGVVWIVPDETETVLEPQTLRTPPHTYTETHALIVVHEVDSPGDADRTADDACHLLYRASLLAVRTTPGLGLSAQVECRARTVRVQSYLGDGGRGCRIELRVDVTQTLRS